MPLRRRNSNEMVHVIKDSSFWSESSNEHEQDGLAKDGEAFSFRRLDGVIGTVFTSTGVAGSDGNCAFERG